MESGKKKQKQNSKVCIQESENEKYGLLTEPGPQNVVNSKLVRRSSASLVPHIHDINLLCQTVSG